MLTLNLLMITLVHIIFTSIFTYTPAKTQSSLTSLSNSEEEEESDSEMAPYMLLNNSINTKSMGGMYIHTFITSPSMSISIISSAGEITSVSNLQEKSVWKLDSNLIEIKVNCSSSYPNRWNFATNLGKDLDIEKWNIHKTRIVPENSIHNFSNYIFQSELIIKFQEIRQNNHFNYSFNCRHFDLKANINSYIELVSNRTHLEVSCMDGPLKNKTELKRFGKNTDCALKIHIDRLNNKFGCSNANGNQTFRNIISCNNNDECGSLAQTSTKCSDTIRNTCEHDCKPLNRSKSGIFICEVGEFTSTNYNSMAVIFYFTLSTPKKRLYLNKEDVAIADLLNLQFLDESKMVYSKQDHFPRFNCTASASYFSMGFFWAVQYQNGTILYYATDSNDTTVYLTDAQAYSTVKELSINANSSQNITIYCLGPRWNSYDWKNVSMTVIYKIGKPFPLKEEEEDGKEDTPTPVSNAEAETETEALSDRAKGAIVTFIILLLIIIILSVIIYKRRKASQRFVNLTEHEINEFLNGDPCQSRDNNNDALFYPYNTDFEISRKQFQIESKFLGDGQFGCVKKGRVGKAPVAIKTIKKSADISYMKALLSELKIMCYVGRHDYILSLIGACTENIKNKEVFLIVEYCENGNLLNYLKVHRGTAFTDYFADVCLDPDPTSSSKNVSLANLSANSNSKHSSIVNYQNATVKKLSSRDLVRWSHEIASGMEYLGQKNIIHGDLAARNILLTKTLVAKVSDFGLSKQLYNYSVYVQRIECPLPLRWMAVESLQDLEFSKESDVWSYGITLWEIYSLGQIPYPGIDWDFESWKLIKDGLRMTKPDYANSEIYRVMLDCWKLEPSHRPSFIDLKDFFQELSIQIDPDCLQLTFARRNEIYPSPSSVRISRL